MLIEGALIIGGATASGWWARKGFARTLGDALTAPAPLALPPPEGLESDAELDLEAQAFRRCYRAALGSLVLSAGGSLAYPPLTVLALPPLMYALVPTLKRVFQEARCRASRLVAFADLASIVGTFALGYVFFAALTISAVLTSQWLARLTEDRARRRLFSVYESLPSEVWVERGAVEAAVPLDQVSEGEVVVVAAGQTVPVDGVILEGVARLDERALTGESHLAERGPGEVVRASTQVVQGRLRVRVEQAGQDCLAAQIVRILNRSADYRLEVRSRGQRLVELGMPPTLALSGLALALLGPVPALAVLYCAAGYNMRYAAPLAVLGYLDRCSRQGILVKDGRALEQLARVDTVVFDKTGTLTEDALEVERVWTDGSLSENQALALAASAEQRQSHPVALAILAEAANRGLELHEPDQLAIVAGAGLRSSVRGRTVWVGSARLMESAGLQVPEALREAQADCAANGTALVFLGCDGVAAAAFELSACIRPEAAAVIRALRTAGREVRILSGDQVGPTRHLAERLGVTDYFAEVLPQEKAAVVRALQAEGKRVCFVGDGINDAIALREADVSVSLAGASTIATDSASIVLMEGNLNHLPDAFKLAQGLKSNLDICAVLSVAPGAVCAGGIFLGVVGLGGAIVWYNLSLLATLGNALRPALGRGHS